MKCEWTCDILHCNILFLIFLQYASVKRWWLMHRSKSRRATPMHGPKKDHLSGVQILIPKNQRWWRRNQHDTTKLAHLTTMSPLSSRRTLTRNCWRWSLPIRASRILPDVVIDVIGRGVGGAASDGSEITSNSHSSLTLLCSSPTMIKSNRINSAGWNTCLTNDPCAPGKEVVRNRTWIMKSRLLNDSIALLTARFYRSLSCPAAPHPGPLHFGPTTAPTSPGVPFYLPTPPASPSAPPAACTSSSVSSASSSKPPSSSPSSSSSLTTSLHCLFPAVTGMLKVAKMLRMQRTCALTFHSNNYPVFHVSRLPTL